jgi:histidinol-phosphate aminotransferase
MSIPTPKPGIMNIAPYVGGKSTLDGHTRVTKLASNENPWGPSPRATDAYAAQIDTLFRYPDSGHSALREAIAEIYDLPAKQVICGNGSDELISLLVRAYAGEGDEVLFSRHGFLMYRIAAYSSGASPVMADETNLHADVDVLLAAVTDATRIVFIANPNNPTGTYLPFSEIQRLREGLRPDIILALDGAYAEYMQTEDYNDGAPLVATSNTVVMHTFSKIYGLPALRLGWCYAPEHIIEVLHRIRGPFNVTAPALAAGIAAVQDQPYIQEMIEKNAQERARVTIALSDMGFNVVPSYGNFLLVKCGHVPALAADKVNSGLLSQGIIVRDVNAYGLPEYLRISVGTEAENTTLLEGIARLHANANAA